MGGKFDLTPIDLGDVADITTVDENFKKIEEFAAMEADTMRAVNMAEEALQIKLDNPTNLHDVEPNKTYNVFVHEDRNTELVEGGPGPGPGPSPEEILVGGVVMWAGSIADIPEGYVLCDGMGGTPNLLDKFVIGAGGEYYSGMQGGSKEVALTQNQLPSHTHTFSGTAASSGAHTHTVSGTLSENTGHTHTWNYYGVLITSGTINRTAQGTWNNADTSATASKEVTFPSAGDHTHSLSSVTAASSGAHTHTVSGSIAAVGSNEPHDNMPPYYALCYIMKTKEEV